jgi:hypothetical protein
LWCLSDKNATTTCLGLKGFVVVIYDKNAC